MNMPFLKDIPPFIFFTGKGGVGKTSTACATAVWLADQGKRTLLVSTDPASNVGQVFSQTIGHRITDISTVENLAAMEVDPMAAAQAYRDRVLDPVRGLMPADVVSSIEEQLSGSCTTEIAAFDEFTGLLTNHELREKYDHIVFDTAPTGHTIRMLELPGAGAVISKRTLMPPLTSGRWWGWRNNSTSTQTRLRRCLMQLSRAWFWLPEPKLQH